MRKILLLLLICIMFSVNNVSAFSDDFNDGSIIDWTLAGAAVTVATGSTVDGSYYASPADTSSMVMESIGENIHYEIYINNTGDIHATGGGGSQAYCDISYNFLRNATAETGIVLRKIQTQGGVETNNFYGTGFTYNYDSVAGETYKLVIDLAGFTNQSNIQIKIYALNGTLLNSQTTVLTSTIIDPDSLEIYAYAEDTGNGAYSFCSGLIDEVGAYTYDIGSPIEGTIDFTADSYNLGDIAYIDATLTNPDYTNYGYRTIIYNPDGSINHAHMWSSGTTTQSGYSINIEELGTYEVKLQRFTGLYSYTDLDTDTAIGKYQNDALMSIYFNDSYYNTGDTVLIQSNISNINNSLYFYEIMIIKPNGNFYNVHNITTNESYSFITNVPGEWQVALTSYPKSDSTWVENQVSDSMVTYGTGVGASWVAFNDTYYYKNSWARINYGIAQADYEASVYDSHRMLIKNEEGSIVFDRQIMTQSGYFEYYFYESGTYTVTIDTNWIAFDWDLEDSIILATDITEVTNTIEGGFTLGVTPTTLNCGQTVYLSADTPNIWNTSSFLIRNVTGVTMADIGGQAGSWKTNQTGQFWVYLNDGGAIQDTGYFYVYGTCTAYDQISQDGQGGIQPKQYPQTDQATSNEGLQNNLLYFLGLPIFWGLIIYVGVIYMLAINGAGSTVPFVTPVIIFMELAIGMLDPYSAFVVVGVIIVYVLGFIAKVFSVSVGDTVSSVTHIGKK